MIVMFRHKVQSSPDAVIIQICACILRGIVIFTAFGNIIERKFE